jgi:hypothetical protein
MNIRLQMVTIFSAIILMTGSLVFAQDAKTEEAASEPEAKSYGINIDFGFATIYNFRGFNSFQENTQQDTNALFAPSITWAIFDTGLYVGYWGAYQMSGDNKTDMVKSALGHEQDLYIGYDKGFADDMITLSAALTYYFYPFASEAATGSSNPSIIEPKIGVSFATPVDLGLSLSYFAGIGDATETLSHLYINPTIGKSLPLGDIVSMDLGFGLGYKVWTDSDMRETNDNAVDILFDAGLSIALPGGLYLSPAVHAAWTNLDRIATETGTRKATVGDEYMIYGSLNVGADF